MPWSWVRQLVIISMCLSSLSCLLPLPVVPGLTAPPFPPHEQLLTVVVGVGVAILILVFLAVVVIGQWGAELCLSFCCHPSPFLLSLLVVPVSSLGLVAPSTLQAVAIGCHRPVLPPVNSGEQWQ